MSRKHNSSQKNTALLIFRIFALALCVFAMGYRLIIAPIFGDGWIQLLDTLGYFTIQTGIMVTVIFALLLISQISGKPKIAPPSYVRGAVLLYTIVVTVIFHVMLKERIDFIGLSNVVLYFNGGVTAILLSIDNILSIKPQTYKWNFLFFWMIYPVTYLLFSVFEGLVFKHFRHYFLNFYESGLNYYLLTITLFIVFFIGVAALIIFFNKIYRKPKEELPGDAK